jgi:hypothetical protein
MPASENLHKTRLPRCKKISKEFRPGGQTRDPWSR